MSDISTSRRINIAFAVPCVRGRWFFFSCRNKVTVVALFRKVIVLAQAFQSCDSVQRKKCQPVFVLYRLLSDRPEFQVLGLVRSSKNLAWAKLVNFHRYSKTLSRLFSGVTMLSGRSCFSYAPQNSLPIRRLCIYDSRPALCIPGEVLPIIYIITWLPVLSRPRLHTSVPSATLSFSRGDNVLSIVIRCLSYSWETRSKLYSFHVRS